MRGPVVRTVDTGIHRKVIFSTAANRDIFLSICTTRIVNMFNSVFLEFFSASNPKMKKKLLETTSQHKKKYVL